MKLHCKKCGKEFAADEPLDVKEHFRRVVSRSTCEISGQSESTSTATTSTMRETGAALSPIPMRQWSKALV